MRIRGVVGLVVTSIVIGGGVAAPLAAATDTSGGAAVPSATDPAPVTGTAPAATVSATKTVSLTRSQTKSVQRRIGVPADGAFGAKSRTALSRYQAKKKLSRTGRPDLETLRAMGLSFADAIERRLTAAAQPSAAGAVQGPLSPAVATALAAANEAVGTPYLSGGESTAGFDCSGLVVWSYGKAGVKLPRTSFDQFEAGASVEQDAIQPGDLVFFATDGPGASHVGIAISPTTAISATSHGVMEHEIFDDYWGDAYVGARRVA